MNIIPGSDDSPEFINEINAILNGVLKSTAPQEFTVVKIDGWFGPRWLSFSGKVLGALPVWKDNLTIPPFVPNRVITQRTFLAPTYQEELLKHPIHRKMESAFALERRVPVTTANIALAWYSGESQKNGRGALMVYLPSCSEYWAWYVSWDKNESWRLSIMKEITVQQLSTFQELGREVLPS